MSDVRAGGPRQLRWIQNDSLKANFSKGSDKLAVHPYMPATTSDVRSYYVHNMKYEPGPVVVTSPWLPASLVEHLD